MTAAVQTPDAEIDAVLAEEDRRCALAAADDLAGIDPDLLPIEATTPAAPVQEIRCGAGGERLCFEPAAPGHFTCARHYSELVATGLVAGQHHRCAQVGCAKGGAPTWCSQHKRGRSRADSIAAHQSAKASLAAATDVMAERLPGLLANRRGRALPSALAAKGLGVHPNSKIWKAALARAIERELVYLSEPAGLYLTKPAKQTGDQYRASITRAAAARREDLAHKIKQHVARAPGVVQRRDLADAIGEPHHSSAFNDAVRLTVAQGDVVVIRKGPRRGMWSSREKFEAAAASAKVSAATEITAKVCSNPRGLCPHPGVEQPLACFNVSQTGRAGRRADCKACIAAKDAAAAAAEAAQGH
jgi:hypothetical protein